MTQSNQLNTKKRTISSITTIKGIFGRKNRATAQSLRK